MNLDATVDPGTYAFMVVLSDGLKRSFYQGNVVITENTAPYFLNFPAAVHYKKNSGNHRLELPTPFDNELDAVQISIDLNETSSFANYFEGDALYFNIDGSVMPDTYHLIVTLSDDVLSTIYELSVEV